MRCAIIGYGYWGKIVKRYVEDAKELELVGICDRHYPQTAKLEHLVEGKQIDCAIVCTPVDAHYDVVKYLLEHSIHVFCEKPLCKNLAQAQELYAQAEKRNVLLYTDYIYTVSPSINALKEYLSQAPQELGDIVHVNMAIEQFGRFYKNDDVFEVIGVHMLSVISYLFGNGENAICVENVQVVKRGKNGLAEAGTVQFAVGKVHGKIECSLLSHEKKRRIEIYCEHGMLIFDMMREDTFLAIKHVEENGQYQECIIQQERYDENNNLKKVLVEFVSAAQRLNRANKEIALCVADALAQIENKIQES